MRIQTCAVMLVMSLFHVSALAAQDTLVTFTGRVLSERDRPLEGAFVTLISLPTRQPERTTRTDSQGNYAFAVPPGDYELRIEAFGRSPVATQVHISGERTGAVAQPCTCTRGIFSLAKSSFFNLTEPNYFISGFQDVGGNHDLGPFEYKNQIKFRVALRYRAYVLGDPKYDSGVYAAYTQNSFWHLWENSAPFFDNNYNPQLILYLDSRTYTATNAGWVPSLRLFVEHESNGRDGIYSRGWNRFGLGLDYGNTDEKIYGTIRRWDPFGVEDGNPDITRFAGRGEFTFNFQPLIGKGVGLGGFGVALKSRVGGRQTFTNEEVDLFAAWSAWNYWRRKSPSSRLPISFMLQVFNGYAENLLTYNDKRTVIRVGLATIQ